MTTEPTVTISVGRKINLGDYESADLFISINGAKAGMTAEEMQPLIDTAAVGWDELHAALQVEIARVRQVHRQRKLPSGVRS